MTDKKKVTAKKTEDAPQKGTDQGSQMFTQEQVDHAVDAAKADLFTQEQVDEAVDAAKADLFTQEQVDEAIKTAMVARNEDEAARPKKPKAIAPAKLKKGASHPSPAEFALTGKTQIICVDADGSPLAGMGALTFSDTDFVADGDAVLLLSAISFPPGAPAADLSALWLLDEDENPISCVRLFSPLPIGGGKSAMMPKRTIKFGKMDS